MTLQFGRTGAMAGVLLLIATSAPFAQINPFRSNTRDNNLTNADVGILTTTTGLVNNHDPVKIGDSQDWSNPGTGNSGKITVKRLFKYNGLACHALRYDIKFASAHPARTYSLDWCKTKNGEWKIKS